MSLDPGDWTPADLRALANSLPPRPLRQHTMSLTVRQQDAAGAWSEISRQEVTASQCDAMQTLAFPPCECPQCKAKRAETTGRRHSPSEQ